MHRGGAENAEVFLLCELGVSAVNMRKGCTAEAQRTRRVFFSASSASLR
jgi:hypothetical protein